MVGGLTLSLLVSLHGFNHPDNLARGVYNRTGITWTPWSQYRNYQRDGFVAGFLYSVPCRP